MRELFLRLIALLAQPVNLVLDALACCGNRHVRLRLV